MGGNYFSHISIKYKNYTKQLVGFLIFVCTGVAVDSRFTIHDSPPPPLLYTVIVRGDSGDDTVKRLLNVALYQSRWISIIAVSIVFMAVALYAHDSDDDLFLYVLSKHTVKPVFFFFCSVVLWVGRSAAAGDRRRPSPEGFPSAASSQSNFPSLSPHGVQTGVCIALALFSLVNKPRINT